MSQWFHQKYLFIKPRNFKYKKFLATYLNSVASRLYVCVWLRATHCFRVVHQFSIPWMNVKFILIACRFRSIHSKKFTVCPIAEFIYSKRISFSTLLEKPIVMFYRLLVFKENLFAFLFFHFVGISFVKNSFEVFPLCNQNFQLVWLLEPQ